MLYLYVFVLFSAAYAQDALVNTLQGQVQGALATDGDYYVFYGIHYAGSSSGANRFKAPTPPAQYPGVFYAIDNSIICAHPTPRGIVGTEDCLVLNIHTSNMTAPKPVMVFLLGDEYTTTDTRIYSFSKIVLDDIVVVTMNYRLSIFGFLCLGVPDAPGNAGLKDVVQGLTWIRDNIAGFGGDPNNVVLFGHGSGAAMVDLITMSPLADNLVHKAITQSGSALAPWAIAYEPVQYARTFAEKLSYSGDTTEELARKLAATDISLLSSALQDFSFYNNTALFAPCLENESLNDTFITEAPINLLRAGNYSHIPYIAGFTDREGTIRAAQAVYDDWLHQMQVNFTNFVQVDLAFDSIQNKTAVANDIKRNYFAARPVSIDTIGYYLNYHGDTMISVPVIRGVQERALTSTAEVRLLEFTYTGTQNSDWIYHQIPIDGVWHGGVLNYVFDYDLKPVDERTRASLVGRYVVFANTGVPQWNATHQTMWFPVVNPSFRYLNYNGDSSTDFIISGEAARSNPKQEIMNYWNNLYSIYYKPPVSVFESPDLSDPSDSSADKIISVAFVLLLSQFVQQLL